MRKHLIAATLLIPATALGAALPASASTATNDAARVKAQAVAKYTAPKASPLRVMRSTGQTCSGTIVYRQTVGERGKPAGELFVYAKPGNGGTMIACFKHVGMTKGKRLPTAVTVIGAKQPPRTPAVQVIAHGNFRSWAGPAVIAGAKGQCVVASGSVKYAGKTYVVTSPILCDK